MAAGWRISFGAAATIGLALSLCAIWTVTDPLGMQGGGGLMLPLATMLNAVVALYLIAETAVHRRQLRGIEWLIGFGIPAVQGWAIVLALPFI
jgi:hypothetical protein